MLTFYGDESLDDKQHFTVVAGYLASVNQWEQFEVDWRIMLAQFNVPYLHMRELAHFIGPFEKWKSAANDSPRASFLKCAANIISCNVKHGVAVYIHDKDWEYVDAVFELHEFVSTPYALAARGCVANANIFRMKQFKSERKGVRGATDLDIQYVFEDGGPDVGGLINAVKRGGFPAPSFEPSTDRTTEKGVIKGLVQLQAADYLAYEIGKFVRDHGYYRRRERSPRKSLLALTEVSTVRTFGTLEGLSNLCAKNKIKQRGS